MVEQSPKSNTEVDRGTYLSNLYTRFLIGDASALLELSKIALGGFKPAQRVIDRIDNDNSFTTVTDTSMLPPINNEGGGIPLEDWSKSDQQRMLRGQRPQGIPDHRNL